MKEWNQLIPPTQRECRRHGPIERLQGNENKFTAEKCKSGRRFDWSFE